MNDEEKIKLINRVTREFTKRSNGTLFDELKKRFVIAVRNGEVYEPDFDNGVYQRFWVERGKFDSIGPKNMPAVNRLKLWLCEEPFLSRLIKEYVSLVLDSREVAAVAEMSKACIDLIHSLPVSSKVEKEDALTDGIKGKIFWGEK